MRRANTFLACVGLAALAAALHGSALHAPALAADGTTDFGVHHDDVETTREIYRAMARYHLVLRPDAPAPLVGAAMYDVDRYAEELDDRLMTSRVVIKDAAALAEIEEIVTQGHIQAALLLARAGDVDASMEHYDRAAELLGSDPARSDEEIEIAAEPGRLPGAVETRYTIGPVKTAAAQLKKAWAGSAIVPFNVRGLDDDTRRALRIERLSGGNDPLVIAGYQLGAKRFAERVVGDENEFRIALPAGLYRLTSSSETMIPVEIEVAAGGPMDPVYVSPGRFTLELTGDNERCRPRLSQNGVVLTSLRDLPFGTLRVLPPAGCTARLPEKITVEPRNEVSLRSEPPVLDNLREGQPIFLFITTPPGSTYRLGL